MAELEFLLDLPVRSEWAHVERVRSALDGFLRSLSGDPDSSHVLSTLAAELSENAVKYGYYPTGEGHLRLRIRGELPAVEVVVENPIDGAEVPRGLSAALAFIAAQPSAQAAYEAKLRERSAAAGSAESGLGLTRVAYELGCSLRAEAHPGRLRVCAALRLPWSPSGHKGAQ